MKTEYEIRILEVEKEDIIQKLEQLGDVKIRMLNEKREDEKYER